MNEKKKLHIASFKSHRSSQYHLYSTEQALPSYSLASFWTKSFSSLSLSPLLLLQPCGAKANRFFSSFVSFLFRSISLKIPSETIATGYHSSLALPRVAYATISHTLTCAHNRPRTRAHCRLHNNCAFTCTQMTSEHVLPTLIAISYSTTGRTITITYSTRQTNLREEYSSCSPYNVHV